MNCQEFENVIIDLARNQMMDAALRESGLAHTETCARCAARIADERALTAGLRALAARDENIDAPPRIEAVLRAAFREPRIPMAVNDRALASAAMAFIPQSAPSRHWKRWALAAAAAILVALALMAQSWLRASSPEPGLQVENKSVPSSPTPLPRELPPPVSPLPDSNQKIERDDAPEREFKQVKYKRRESAPHRDLVKQPPTEVEIVTDFFPLTYDTGLMQMEGGRVVRVQMPRSALLTFGLPMNIERASEPVKADVVMGHDGLARAIRFVR
jgi:hypothetical protein